MWRKRRAVLRVREFLEACFAFKRPTQGVRDLRLKKIKMNKKIKMKKYVWVIACHKMKYCWANM